jgi:hypothetical protein
MSPVEECNPGMKHSTYVDSKLLKGDADKAFQLAYIRRSSKGDVGGAAIREVSRIYCAAATQ